MNNNEKGIKIKTFNHSIDYISENDTEGKKIINVSLSHCVICDNYGLKLKTLRISGEKVKQHYDEYFDSLDSIKRMFITDYIPRIRLFTKNPLCQKCYPLFVKNKRAFIQKYIERQINEQMTPVTNEVLKSINTKELNSILKTLIKKVDSNDIMDHLNE